MSSSLPPEGRGPVFVQAVRAALGRVPLWGLTTLALFALALPSGLLARHAYGDMIGRSYAPGAALRSLDVRFVVDHAGELSDLAASLAAVNAALGLGAVLLGVFLAGGWLQVFLERTDGHSVRRFLHGSVRHFWRFFRVLVLVALACAAVQRVVYHEPWHVVVETHLLGLPEPPAQGVSSGPEYTEQRLEELGDELTARRVVWFQDGLHALLVALVLTWALYTRTRLALHDASSALWAGLCTVFTLLRHPVRTLRPMLLLLVAEAAVVAVASSLNAWLEGTLSLSSPSQSVALILTLSLAVTAVSEILHAARYHAAIQVSRRVIGPIARPDPWRHSIGAPGGPQYPIIEGGDEYGVSL